MMIMQDIFHISIPFNRFDHSIIAYDMILTKSVFDSLTES